jgi:hypothetical protein
MHRFAVVALCSVCVFTGAATGQSVSIEPVHAAPGTVLTFHMQTRLNPTEGNDLDVLPKGTVLRVKIMNGIDSSVDRDGSEFHGEVVESIVAGSKIIVHTGSEVRGILVLLRSRNHPEGFRYELLVTSLTDHEKRYDLTASLNPSFLDAGAPPAPVAKTETKEPGTAGAGTPSAVHN